MTTTDRMSQDMAAVTARVAELSEDELQDALDEAARHYVTYDLWSALPEHMQGYRDAEAWAVRSRRRDAARDLWLAAKQEAERRLDLAR